MYVYLNLIKLDNQNDKQVGQDGPRSLTSPIELIRAIT
jgi:hypothetical protein